MLTLSAPSRPSLVQCRWGRGRPSGDRFVARTVLLPREICIRSDKADGAMARREFATQKKFHDYAERTGQGYLWEGTLTFAKRQRRSRARSIRHCGCTHVSWS